MPTPRFRRNVSTYRTTKSAPKALVKKPRKVNFNKSYKLSKPFKQILDKALDSRESNQYQDWVLRRQQYPSTMLSGGDLIPVIPDINQAGTHIGGIATDTIPATRGTRFGSKIRLKSCVYDFAFSIPGDDIEYSEDRACITVCVMLLSSKRFPNIGDIRDNWDAGAHLSSQLLDTGGYDDSHLTGTSAFNGRVGDELMRVNTEEFTCHDRRVFDMKRGLLPGDTALDSVGGHMPTLLKRVRLRWKCKNRILRYNEPLDTQPANGTPFVFIGFTYSSTGAAPSTAGVPFVYGRCRTQWENMVS